MIVEKSKKIKDRVFGLSDIQAIGKIIDAERKKAIDEGKQVNINYILEFVDSTRYVSEDVDIFDESSIDRRILGVSIFLNLRNGNQVNMEICAGDHDFSKVNVQGEQGWVNDVFSRIETKINAANPQTFWFARHRIVAYFLCSILWGYAFVTLFGAIGLAIGKSIGGGHTETLAVSDENREILLLCLKMFIEFTDTLWHYLRVLIYFVIGSSAGGHQIYNWILSAWPSIELDIGPAHQDIKSRRKKVVICMVLMVALPIVTSIVTALVNKHLGI
jgi:hypothetical protein